MSWQDILKNSVGNIYLKNMINGETGVDHALKRMCRAGKDNLIEKINDEFTEFDMNITVWYEAIKPPYYNDEVWYGMWSGEDPTPEVKEKGKRLVEIVKESQEICAGAKRQKEADKKTEEDKKKDLEILEYRKTQGFKEGETIDEWQERNNRPYWGESLSTEGGTSKWRDDRGYL